MLIQSPHFGVATDLRLSNKDFHPIGHSSRWSSIPVLGIPLGTTEMCFLSVGLEAESACQVPPCKESSQHKRKQREKKV